MYSFEKFGLREMIESGQTLRHLGAKSRCMEEAAREIVDFFYESFLTSSGDAACALVRCFKTHRFSDLPPGLREATGANVEEAVQCLTLLATRGVEPAWNDRHASCGHRSIPLATPQMIERAPMIARVIQQMGLRPHDVLYATPNELDEVEKRTLDVFHVQDARESSFVPAQDDFVKPYGVRSVLGCGGILPTGDFFFVVLFARVSIDAETAMRFKTLAICIKLVLLNHMQRPVFAI